MGVVGRRRQRHGRRSSLSTSRTQQRRQISKPVLGDDLNSQLSQDWRTHQIERGQGRTP